MADAVEAADDAAANDAARQMGILKLVPEFPSTPSSKQVSTFGPTSSRLPIDHHQVLRK